MPTMSTLPDPNAYGLMSYRFATVASFANPPNIPGINPQDLLLRRDTLRQLLNTSLWPEYDSNTNGVLPPHADALLTADFETLETLRPAGTKWFDAAQVTKGKSEAKLLYLCEDFVDVASVGIQVGSNTAFYPTGPAASFAMYTGMSAGATAAITLERITELMFPVAAKGSFAALNWLNLSLKHLFQRPRPYQYAFSRGHHQFLHALAQTAHSPSLPSGHAFQHGLMALLAHSAMLTDAELRKYANELPAWAASVGDRRCYAGLHFPSDNWASWLVLARNLDLALGAYTDIDFVREQLTSSIKSSQCYLATRDRGEYAPALAALRLSGLINL